MGIITVEKSNNLLWLGRYTERVHTTLKYYIEATDRMIDRDPGYYAIFCEKIGILFCFKIILTTFATVYYHI